MHDQVAASTFLQTGQALAAQNHRLARLRPWRERDIDLALQGLRFHCRPQRCLRKRDSGLRVQIGAIALKARIVRNAEVDVEVSRMAAPRRPFASSCQSQSGAILHSLGHADLQTLFRDPQAASAA